MRFQTLAILLTLIGTAAMAQPTPPPPEDLPPPGPAPQGAPPPMAAPMPPPGPGPGVPPGPAGHAHMSPKQRFEAANVTQDGKLTLDQAQRAHWMGIARHFPEIDVDRKGYVTLQDIKEWRKAKRAARRGGQGGPPPGAPPPPAPE